MHSKDETESILIEAEQNGSLLKALVSQDLRAQYRELGKILCELHNSDSIDITSDQNIAAIDALEHNDFWVAIHPLNDAIPNLQCSEKEMLKLVHLLVQKAGNDLAAGRPNSSLIAWSKNNPEKAHKIVDGIKELDGLCLARGLFAVLGLDNEPLVFDLVQHSENTVVGLGLRALGRMESISMSGTKDGINKAFDTIDSQTDPDLRASAIEAVFRLWEKLGPSEPYLQQELIQSIRDRGDPTELSMLAAMLFYHNKGLPKESINLVLELLASMQSNSAATLQNLDQAIKIDDDRWVFEQVVSVFAACIPDIEKNHGQLKFHCFDEWVWNSPENTSFLFAEWLTNGEFALCSYLEKVLRRKSDNQTVEIQKPHLPHDVKSQIFMAQKCVGFLWHREITAASILLSIVKNGKQEAREMAEELLFNPMLLSYGGDLRQFLEAQLANKSKRISESTMRLLSQHDEHIAGLEAANDLVELLPSIEHRRAVAMKDGERNREIQKQAHEKSIFASIVRRQTLLYGRKSFSVVHGPNGETSPTVSPLSEFSHSVELPRLLVVDPVGFNEMIKSFRAMPRSSA